jgi:hypothetical protein
MKRSRALWLRHVESYGGAIYLAGDRLCGRRLRTRDRRRIERDRVRLVRLLRARRLREQNPEQQQPQRPAERRQVGVTVDLSRGPDHRVVTPIFADATARIPMFDRYGPSVIGTRRALVEVLAELEQLRSLL